MQVVQDPPDRQTYNILSFLDQQSALPFQLSRAVRKAIEPLLSGAVCAPMIQMAERLERDFPHTPSVSSLYVRCMFLKAERKPTEDLEEVKAMIGNHKVGEADVLWASLSNECRTTVPIRYAVKHVEGFSLQHFTEKLVDQLLRQPYRGIMLRELDRLFRDLDSSASFHRLLTAAVETQGELANLFEA